MTETTTKPKACFYCGRPAVLKQILTRPHETEPQVAVVQAVRLVCERCAGNESGRN